MKNVGLSLLTLAITTALAGCGSDTESTESSTSYSVPKSGAFVDATVEGLYYKSGSKSGYTSSTGVYDVDTSKAVVTFYLGGENGLEIGTISARSVSTPFEAAGTYERSVNLARLLLTIDDTSDESYIVIPNILQGVTEGSNIATALQKISLDDAEFEGSITDLLSILNVSSIATADEAIEHMNGSLSNLTRGSSLSLNDWKKGSNGVFVSRSTIQRIKNSSSDSYDFAIHGDKTQGNTVFNKTSGMMAQTFVLNSESFITKTGSNDNFFSGSMAQTYLECAVAGGSYSKDSGCSTSTSTIMNLSGHYQYVLNNPDSTLTSDKNYTWTEVAEMGGAYECMSNSSCSESTLTKYQVVENRDDSDSKNGSEIRNEILSGTYDPITGVYTQVRSKKYTVTSEASVGRVEESIEFIYQIDSVGKDKYVDFTGTWKATQTAPGCDEVAVATWVFNSTGATVTGEELSVNNTTSPYTCTVTTRSVAETSTYNQLADMDYWWFTTNSDGNSKATLDQLNTTIRWMDGSNTKINRFSYVPAGSNWDLGVLVRDTLNDSGAKIATTVMRKISQ